MRAALLLGLFAFILTAAAPAAAHRGKTNKLGCHKQNGKFHCHEIPTNKKKKKAKKKRRAVLDDHSLDVYGLCAPLCEQLGQPFIAHRHG